uniref:G domain-containing protein n=1 Tax=Panagrolaimus superbus TaxID=310955 RepID=A0A914XZ48_9BILA
MHQKEYNILCLGATGVGKTTTLNAFSTYLNHRTWESAMDVDELPILSCVRFSFATPNLQPLHVCLGDDDNERFYGICEASTLEPKIYRFEHGDALFNFIDVPGSADPRGIEQDDKNNKLILDVIGSLDNLHTICLFFKGDEKRLTAQVEYCLNEAFTKLHKDNIVQVVFIFTYTRGGHYRPGESLVTLREYFERLQQSRNITVSIQPQNAFCIDNIAFKGLCLLQAYPNSDEYINMEEYKRCYEISRDAMLRLFQDIPKKQSLEAITTLSVNDARIAILCLIEPLSVVSNAIQANEGNLENNQQQIQERVAENGVHEEYDIQKVDLPEPATVCTAPECSQQIPIEAGSDEMITVYPQKCHSPCFQSGITLSLIGDERLKECQTFRIEMKDGDFDSFPDEGDCKGCNHSYKVHQHIKADYRRAIREIRIPPTNAEGAREFVEQRKVDLQREQSAIIRAMATFGAYLKSNAILSYNRAFPQFIQIEIEKEQRARNLEQVRRLERLLLKFQNEELMIGSSEDQGTNRRVIDAAHIGGVIEELFTLPINGPRIQELYENERNLNRQNVERNAIKVVADPDNDENERNEIFYN